MTNASYPGQVRGWQSLLRVRSGRATHVALAPGHHSLLGLIPSTLLWFNRSGHRDRRGKMMRSVRIGAFILLIFPGLLTAQEAPRGLPTAAHRHAFLEALEGAWEGQARVTPVGPRPYDITFVRTASRRLEGHANPGASTHYWTFYEEANTLQLRFLSTFAGNRQPLWLTAIEVRAEAIVFRSPQPDLSSSACDTTRHDTDGADCPPWATARDDSLDAHQ